MLLYYSLCVLIMPFVDHDHHLHAYFPPTDLVLQLPILLFFLLGTTILTFLSLTLLSTTTPTPTTPTTTPTTSLNN